MKYKRGDELIYKGKDAVIVNLNNYKENKQEYDYQIISNNSGSIWVYEFELTS